MSGSSVVFASTSEWKRQQVREFLAGRGLTMREPPGTVAEGYGIEIQAASVEEVCRFKAISAMQRLGTPVLVDDTGLAVEALRGFPGPYAKYANLTLGPSGLLALLHGTRDRSAHIVSCVGYCDRSGDTHLFTHRMGGTIAPGAAAASGNAWADMLFFSIFIPTGHGQTLAEMPPADVVQLAEYPLRRAIDSFCHWFEPERG